MTPPTWHVGIDAGGTKTVLLARSTSDEPPIRIEGPGANLQHVGVATVCQVLTNLMRRFQEASGTRATTLCAGVAGAGRDDDQETIAEHLRNAFPDYAPEAIDVVHDGIIALEAAFEGESGIIAIAGTGSLILGRDDAGQLLRAGGWGYLLGDDGSGYALGRSGLRAVAAAYDGGPSTRLTQLLSTHQGITSNDILIETIYGNDLPISEMAPLVLQAAADGDPVAEAIVRAETDALAQQVQWVANGASSTHRQFALLGGLTGSPYYVETLSGAVKDVLPGWTRHDPAHPPVMGALWLAQKLDPQR